MLFLYCETPIHPGTGTSLSIVDLPIQRERITNLPIIQAPSLKGVLRAEVKRLLENCGDSDAEQKTKILFGPEPQHAHEHAGCISPHDARILLFPVRSLVGVFAWTTCPMVLERFKREATAAGLQIGWQVPPLLPNDQKAFVASTDTIVSDGKVVLEEFAFDAEANGQVKTIAKWLAQNALPQSQEYQPWKDWLPKRFVVLPDDAFRDFTQMATEVISRIRLDHDQEKKTVAEGGLWTEEHLPSETLLYAPIFASKPRAPNASQLGLTSADEALKLLGELNLDRLQIGGDETVGRGVVKVRLRTPTEGDA